MQDFHGKAPRIALALLIVANLAFSFWLFRTRGNGFFAPHGDEVARAAIGYSLRHGGGFPEGSLFMHWKPLPGPFPHKVWCPLQFYLIAAVYALTGDLLLSPFLVNSIFAAGILVLLFATIGKAVPGCPFLAFAGAAVYAALPATKVVDVSGLDQTIANFFLLAGVCFWMDGVAGERRSNLDRPLASQDCDGIGVCPIPNSSSGPAALRASLDRGEMPLPQARFRSPARKPGLWERRPRRAPGQPGSGRDAPPTNFACLLAAAAAFLFASATRFEGWFGVAVFGSWLLWRAVFPVSSLPRRRLIPPLVIALLFIAAWSAWQLAHFGRLEYFSYHRAEALLGRDKIYLERSAVEKILFYPRLLVRSAPVVAIFSLVGLVLFRRLSRPARLAAVFASAEFLILTASTFSVGVPHGVQRLMATNLMLFLPVAVAGLAELLVVVIRRKAAPAAAVQCLIFAAVSVASVPSSLYNSISADIFRIGRFLERAAGDGTIGAGERVYVEYTGKEAGREWDTQKISLFVPAIATTQPAFPWKGAGERIAARLEKDRIALAVVWSEGARGRLPEFMREVLVAGPYAVYGKKVTKGY